MVANTPVSMYTALTTNVLIICCLAAVVVNSQRSSITLNDIAAVISSGYKSKFKTDAVDFIEYMESAVILVRPGLPPISVLDLCGSTLSCLSYRKMINSHKSWFESLVACTLMQFGGTTLTGWLLGQTPSWIVSHSAFPALLVAWWLTFFSPFDIYHKVITRVPLCLFIVGLFASVSGGHAVTSWGVDKALNNAFHVNHVRISQSFLTCIACGTLSASGGGFLADALRFSHSTKSFTLTETPSIFIPGKYPQSATISRSFYLALLYYVLLNKHLYFPWAWQADPAEARTIICFLQVLNFTISAIFSVDILQSLSLLLVHGLLGITPLVSNGEKSRDEKISTLHKEVKKFTHVPEPTREPIPVDIKHTKKESKKKK